MDLLVLFQVNNDSEQIYCKERIVLQYLGPAQ